MQMNVHSTEQSFTLDPDDLHFVVVSVERHFICPSRMKQIHKKVANKVYPVTI